MTFTTDCNIPDSVVVLQHLIPSLLLQGVVKLVYSHVDHSSYYEYDNTGIVKVYRRQLS